jgi:hypothetical protein
MPKSKLKLNPDAFNPKLIGGDLNGNCKACGAIATLEYQGLDWVHLDFRIVCNRCKTYAPLKIRMLPKYLTPEPYRGRLLFEKWQTKSQVAAIRAAKKQK